MRSLVPEVCQGPFQPSQFWDAALQPVTMVLYCKHRASIYTERIHRLFNICIHRASTHGAMGHQTDPSWCTHCAISRSSQCSTTGAKKGCGMCYPVCGMVHIKDNLLPIV